MPLPDQCGVVASRLEQRGQGRLALRQAEALAVLVRRHGLLEPHEDPVLVTAGDDGGAAGRADGRVGVGLGQSDALRRPDVFSLHKRHHQPSLFGDIGLDRKRLIGQVSDRAEATVGPLRLRETK
jgi:hypothetical protein